MSGPVLVAAELRGGALRAVAIETLAAARALGDASQREVHAIVLGPPGSAAHADVLAHHGADLVLVAEHAGFAVFNPEAQAATIAARARSSGADAVLCAASIHGREIAARVAAALDAPLLPDVIGLEYVGGALRARHPVNTGKVIATLEATGSPVVVSIRPKAFPPTAASRALRTETLTPAVDPAASRVVVTELRQGNTARPDLSEAPIVVAGGRGLKAAENFRLVEDLAAAFGNAAVGCTRAVSDEGWRPHSDQIGQTGRVVSPDLYVAVGISGAIQHVAGMRTARTVVAINKDREAPIFKVADYGIVGDVFEVVPALTDAVRTARTGG